jgi:hypothetical protein
MHVIRIPRVAPRDRDDTDRPSSQAGDRHVSNIRGEEQRSYFGKRMPLGLNHIQITARGIEPVTFELPVNDLPVLIVDELEALGQQPDA